MNTIQKICLMVGVGSIPVFLITVFVFGFDGMITYKNPEYTKWVNGTFEILTESVPKDSYFESKFQNNKEDYISFYNQRVIQKHGDEAETFVNPHEEYITEFRIKELFRKNLISNDYSNPLLIQTNMLGVLAVFNIVACTIGFLLFKD